MARLIRSPPNVGGYYVQLPRAQYPVITKLRHSTAHFR